LPILKGYGIFLTRMIDIKDIGQQDRRVTLKMYTQTILPNLERIDNWSTYNTVWAAKENAAPDESVSDDMGLALGRTNFYIRYDANVNEKWRVNCEGREYSISGVQEIGRNVYMMLSCETITLLNSGIDSPLTVDTVLYTTDSTLLKADATVL
jgi:SPP1 family predicted phage head-tail adaptor